MLLLMCSYVYMATEEVNYSKNVSGCLGMYIHVAFRFYPFVYNTNYIAISM